ncbi:MAG: GMC family oxidoreductase N-terminal domain-containing protein, partial [Novosphingobium sp.]
KQVSCHLELAKADPRTGRGNGRHLLCGWDTFAAGCDEEWARRARPDWALKNYGSPADPGQPVTSCSYCGYCNTGCPYARKVAPAQKHLPEACKEGAQILAETKVERIVWASGARLRHATGVVALCGPARIRREIPARVGVVVAAGAIASSKLLKRSGVRGTGRGISLNIACPMVARMDAGETCDGAPFTPSWDEDQMTTLVDCGDFLLESHFQPPQSMAMLMPGWFEDMDARMRAYSRIRSAGVLVPLDRNGRMRCGKLQTKFKRADMDLLRRSLGVLAKVHFAAGAVEVWPALRTGRSLPRPERGCEDAVIERFFRKAVKDPDDLTLSSAHPHGGNPINRDPAQGVVDPDCRLHGATNVLVTDASVFPSSIRVNAHFSTMAVAQYATGYDNPFA